MKDFDYVPERGHWMQTSTGKRFFPASPRPEEVCLSDIANGLAMDCRYSGQIRVDRFYSVAEHSGLIALHVLKHGPSAGAAMVALLHDAHEAYTRDLPRAVKRTVGAGYRDMADRIQRAVWDHFGLADEAREYAACVKELDTRIIVNEKLALMRTPLPWDTDSLEPLPMTIRCLLPVMAKQFFVQVYWQCCLAMGADPEEVEL